MVPPRSVAFTAPTCTSNAIVRKIDLRRIEREPVRPMERPVRVSTRSVWPSRFASMAFVALVLTFASAPLVAPRLSVGSGRDARAAHPNGPRSQVSSLPDGSIDAGRHRAPKRSSTEILEVISALAVALGVAVRVSGRGQPRRTPTRRALRVTERGPPLPLLAG
jgi:hypothetical protein